ncbi:MAG: thymidine phosphorylase, partial [Edaphobacter sp.]
HAKLGDKLEAGQPLATLFAEDPTLLDEPEAMLRETLQISATPPNLQPLIREVVKQWDRTSRAENSQSPR